MSKSDELVNFLSKLLEKGILNSQDVKKEIITNLKFKRDKAINDLRLVSKDDFNILKKIVEKQGEDIKKFLLANLLAYFCLIEYFPHVSLLYPPQLKALIQHLTY